MTASLRVGALAAAVVLGIWPVSAAVADEPADASAWWWSAQTGVGPFVPRPPTVPDGGLYVAANPVTGTDALSALRVDVGGEVRVSELRLVIAETAGAPSLSACPTVDPWSPVEGGPLSDAPTYDCGQFEVEGIPSEGAWLFDLTGLPDADGVVDLAVVPRPGQSDFFNVSFEPPQEAFAVATAPQEPTPPPDPEPAATPTPANEPRAPRPASQPPLTTTPERPAVVPAPEVAAPAATEPPRQSTTAPPTAAASPTGPPTRRAIPPLALPFVVLATGAAWWVRARQVMTAAAEHPLAVPMLDQSLVGASALLLDSYDTGGKT